jgi:protein involved in polysaccharide export with SLBB domain
LGQIHILGLSVDSLQSLLNSRYSTLVRNSNVQVTLQREITLYGQVRFPGVYPVDPGMTTLALMAKAGGPAGAGSAPSATLERADGTRWSLPRSARLGTVEVHRNDAVYMAEESFFIRNSATIGATQVVMNLLATVVGLFVFISR